MLFLVDLAGPALSMMLAAAGAPPVDGISVTDCDYGQKYQLRQVSCEFVVSNTSDRSRHVIAGKPAYPSDAISPAEVTVEPHGTAKFKAILDLSLDGGNAAHTFPLASKDGKKEVAHYAVARGFVESVIDEPRTILDFEAVDLKLKDPPTKVFEIKSHEPEGVKIAGIIEKPPYLNVDVSEDGEKATLTFDRQKAPWSFVNEIVRFKTNSKVQPEIAIQVQADIHGDVLPDSNPFNLGLFRQGNKNEFAIRVTDRSNRPLHFGDISLEGVHGHVEQSNCLPKTADCKLLKLTISNDQPLGHAVGKIVVGLPDYQRQLTINVWGLYVKQTTEVKDLNEEAKKAQALREASALKPNAGGGNLKQALQAATAPPSPAATPAAPPAPPPGHGPLIRWSVAHEELVHGYLIYRAESENGPFIRLIKDSINATRTEGGSLYQWRDNDAVAGRTYWYYVVTLFNDGKKQQLSGAAKVVAK